MPAMGLFFFLFTTETGRESERQVALRTWGQELDSRAYQVWGGIGEPCQLIQKSCTHRGRLKWK